MPNVIAAAPTGTAGLLIFTDLPLPVSTWYFTTTVTPAARAVVNECIEQPARSRAVSDGAENPASLMRTGD
jgi:hypothetical protein